MGRDQRAGKPTPPRRRALRVAVKPIRGIRWSRVRVARARVAADYYDRGEVRERLVDALLSDLLHA